MARKHSWPGMVELLTSLQGAMKTDETANGGTARRGARFVLPRLAGRENEILRLIEENQSKTKIAAALGVTRQTLRNHLERMNVRR